MYMLTNGRLILYTLSWQPPFQGLKACTFWCFTLYDIEYHKRLLPIKVFITSLEGRCFFILPFPKASIGNPVLINSMSYGCPTETFGHDKLTKRGLGNSPSRPDPFLLLLSQFMLKNCPDARRSKASKARHTSF